MSAYSVTIGDEAGIGRTGQTRWPNRPNLTRLTQWRLRSGSTFIIAAGQPEGWAMRRRIFLGALGSAALLQSLPTRAQQPTMSVIGYLAIRGPDDSPELLRGLRQGLKEEGFAEGENIAVSIDSLKTSQPTPGTGDRFGENRLP